MFLGSDRFFFGTFTTLSCRFPPDESKDETRCRGFINTTLRKHRALSRSTDQYRIGNVDFSFFQLQVFKTCNKIMNLLMDAAVQRQLELMRVQMKILPERYLDLSMALWL